MLEAETDFDIHILCTTVRVLFLVLVQIHRYNNIVCNILSKKKKKEDPLQKPLVADLVQPDSGSRSIKNRLLLRPISRVFCQ